MKRHFYGVLGLSLLIMAFGGLTSTSAQEPDYRYEGTLEAPAFATGLDWLNVENPLTIDGLRGKIIILDFWTYGCINCIHMIPVLHQVEERFAEEVVVIGVHSSKFDNEGQTENIQQIVQRYDIEHPVINDSDFTVWQDYGIPAWPTFVIIDPLGRVVAAQSGEVPFATFDQYLTGMVEYYDALPDVELNREPLELAIEGAGDPGTPLLFPGKVLADPRSERLFIADSNHHRIVIADLNTYEVLETIGTGQRGYTDGNYASAQFDQPQGMELIGDLLYVADVNNHVIRTVDLAAKTVSTAVGLGEMGRGIASFDTVYSDPLQAALRSPWDVELGDDNLLYVAMAGSHQIWQFNLETSDFQAAVGAGSEAQFNATLATSALAQPSGLHYVDGLLYFADSESSTIRVADIPNNSLYVASGTTENNLFDYGDVDGVAGTSRLQHALGVTGNEAGSMIYIADTYNSKVKQYNPETGETTTLFGLSGNGGFRDGDADTAQFDEPGGLDYVDGRLYVADTNNHAIRVIDLEAGLVETVQFPNPEALVIEANAVTILGGNAAAGATVTLAERSIGTGEGAIQLNLALPEGFKINDLTESSVALTSSSEAVQFEAERVILDNEAITIPATFSEGSDEALLTMTLFYCEAENEAFCLIEEVTLVIPITVTEGDDDTITIDHIVELPEGFSSGL